MSSHGPVRHLACPARFERATYALEAGKMSWNNSRNNGIKVLARGVASAPRTLGLVGMGWILLGIHRWLDGQSSNLSGKPTKLLTEAPFKGYFSKGLPISFSC
jgi:hypothetical protein